MVFICNYCHKEYKNKGNFEKHVLLCEIIRRNKYQKEKDNEEDNPINIKDLLILTKELAYKINRLEEDNKKFKNIIYNNQKKINVIQWLNLNEKSTNSFNNWVENLKLYEKDLDYIFEHGNINGINIIINELNNNEIIPIKSFTQKTNSFYIYDYENTILVWKTMTEKELEKFYNKLNSKILNLFKIWQENNSHKLKNENFAEEYINKVKKIIGKDLNKEIELQKFKNKLFNNLKINIKTIIEYDFS